MTSSLTFQLSGRTVRLASLALLLLLTTHSNSSASTFINPSGLETALAESPMKPAFTATSSSRIIAVTPPAVESPQQPVVLEKRMSDWDGVRRDTAILIGAQVVAAGVTLLLPESVSGWSSADKQNSFKKYGNNFVHPVLDKDKFYINYILHPYWGATYYTRARERGLSEGESLVYSTVMSALYEFGAECFYEKPSIQDLIVTPVVGSLIGAYIFEPYRNSIRQKSELRWYDHAALAATDPIGLLSLGFEKMFGIKPTIKIEYTAPKLQKSSTGSTTASNGSRIGMVWQFPFN